MSANKGWHTAELPLDVKKAFDLVRRGQMLYRAKEQGYPVAAAVMDYIIYGRNRRIGYDGLVTGHVKAKRGIAAGAGGATFELAVLTIGKYRKIVEQPEWQIGHMDLCACG